MYIPSKNQCIFLISKFITDNIEISSDDEETSNEENEI